MDERFKNTEIRFLVVTIAIGLGFLCIAISIFKTQYIERSQWERVTTRQVKKNQVVSPTRGNILDANGHLLASSVPQYTLHMDTRVEALHLDNGKLMKEYIDSMADGLSRILGDRSAQEYKQVILNAYRRNNGKGAAIRLYPGRVSYIQKKEIQKLPLICRGVYKSGVSFEDLHRRQKPFGTLGARTIGNIYGAGGHGNAGLEQRFDSYLVGESGMATRQQVAGHRELVVTKPAKDGMDVHTTLDVNLLDICESALRARLDHTQADWGCCILMETHSGKIRAICNLDRGKDGRYWEWSNHAVRRVEPGSTFKTIALMAAMDDGKIGLYDTVSVSRNGWKYGASRHTDSHPHDTVYTVRSALAISSNIALAKIITRSYDKKAEKFVNKLRKMGLCDSVYCEIPGAQTPLIKVPDDAVTLSKMAYGYSVELSPMEIITFYNAIANDGKMIRPYMVSSITSQGKVVEKYDTEVLKSSLCSQSTLNDIRLALHDVVWDNDLPGTASVLKWDGKIIYRKAQSDLVHIAGKTGTAQLFYGGQYHNNSHRMTFVGYFPEEDPQYTCLCMIENPQNKGAYDAGMDCGTVVRQIAEKTMVYAGHYVIKDGNLVYELK